MKNITKVFWIALALVVLAVGFGALAPESFELVTGKMQSFITSSFGWYYLSVVSIMVVFTLIIIVSPFGKIRLGKDTDRPEYTRVTWFSMLFSAGMGIGLVFWGAAEPLSHYAISPATADPGTREAFRESMRFTFFHWGLHAWAIYAIVALALAYFQFRKGEPGLISATLKPIFGDKMNGPWGVLVDVFAVFATVVGVATTLGLGAIQINGGLSYIFGIENAFGVQVIIIAVVTVLFLISAWSGLSKGIKYLSNINMILAVSLLALVVILGPTVLIFNMFTDTLGRYVQNIVQMSFSAAPLNVGNREWINGWTIFYWAWWISWSPFVGIFIARVSKGRTIREFLIGVLMIPSIVSFFWFSAFGTTAINIQDKVKDLTALDLKTEETLFAVFNEMPLSMLLSIIAVVLISTFFITSADSATFVLGMQTTNGSLNPSNIVKVIWGLAQSSIAVILLSSEGLGALQSMLIVAAFPFSFIMVLMMLSLYKSLSNEAKKMKISKP
ncbi:BCCT family transporter [Paenisporosarcina sp. TG20]|uniref:glycine betaine uptake BCCT transporter n=1 Tax=Paenisporosarcina sp. TG20 TaxID=1211706 RepID=UPI0002FCFA7C|nr:BCCT family transporter [Paenisporosarcina sp. TG20]